MSTHMCMSDVCVVLRIPSCNECVGDGVGTGSEMRTLRLNIKNYVDFAVLYLFAGYTTSSVPIERVLAAQMLAI